MVSLSEKFRVIRFFEPMIETILKFVGKQTLWIDHGWQSIEKAKQFGVSEHDYAEVDQKNFTTFGNPQKGTLGLPNTPTVTPTPYATTSIIKNADYTISESSNCMETTSSFLTKTSTSDHSERTDIFQPAMFIGNAHDFFYCFVKILT